jgi:hypothetical protein
MNNRDLIKQYVDSGLKIPQSQFNKLSGSELNTYLRKRLIAQEHTNNTEGSITFYEYDKFTPEQKLKLVSLTTEDNIRSILVNFDYNDNDFLDLITQHKDNEFLKQTLYLIFRYSSKPYEEDYKMVKKIIDKLGRDIDQNVVKEISKVLPDFTDTDKLDILKYILKQYDELDLYNAPLDELITASQPEEKSFIKYIVKSVEEKETYGKPRIDFYTLRTLFSYAQDVEFETNLAKYILNNFYTFQDEQDYLEKIIKDNSYD